MKLVKILIAQFKGSLISKVFSIWFHPLRFVGNPCPSTFQTYVKSWGGVISHILMRLFRTKLKMPSEIEQSLLYYRVLESTYLKYFFYQFSLTAKRKLERLHFSTSSSFVKIWSACSCEFKAYFWTFWAL